LHGRDGGDAERTRNGIINRHSQFFGCHYYLVPEPARDMRSIETDRRRFGKPVGYPGLLEKGILGCCESFAWITRLGME
jgi:hypothetical protein